MARPERNNVDYFPFLCKEGKAMYYIEQKYGNDGYATWVKILRQLAVTNYHYLNLSDKIEFMYLASKCKVSEEILSNIILDLCEMGEFNKDLWIENKIVFSEKFIDSIKDAYFKRSNECISLQGLLLLLSSLGIRKPSKQLLKDTVKPQTILDYTIEENTKEDKRKFTPPVLGEVLAYFKDNGYSEMSGVKAFNYYNSAGWKDSTGKQVKNWKQKMHGVWFKPENIDKGKPGRNEFQR